MQPSLIRQRLLRDSRPALQRLLARHAFWDEDAQKLIIDLTPFHAGLMPVSLPGWEQLVGWQGRAPELPDWPLLNWPAQPAVQRWRRHIPQWVEDTLLRLPRSHQLKLLYLSARYPQMLELLEKMPVLAWRIAASGMDEQTLRTLFPKPRTFINASVGWPAERAALRFLQRLRLRRMDEEMIAQVETCLNEPNTLHRSVELPRINSMALTLAANFPDLVATPLHHSLARQPCRPEQCRQMHALIEDALKLAKWLDKDITPIQNARFLVEIEDLYSQWLAEAMEKGINWTRKNTDLAKIGETPSDWHQLSERELDESIAVSAHAFFIEHSEGARLFRHAQHPIVVALMPDGTLVARTSHNRLPTPEQQACIALFKAKLMQTNG
ncbi:hypothetical protein [Sulfurivirga sp.]|uniref:hypothetical protein n=1 Tax=Sulfurivirga sp. TaxID=2614236 RepID=UPI0025EA605D|nr:hypothetical protein [Sulfurivirga sp.]